MPPAVRMSIDEALDKINTLEDATKQLQSELDVTKQERDQANSVLNAQIRASFLREARATLSIPETQLQKMGNDELETVLKNAKLIKHPNPKSILFSADQEENSGLIDLYSERIKRGRA